MMRQLAAEGLKIRTAPYTWYVLGAVVIALMGCALIAWHSAALWDALSAEQRVRFSVAPLASLVAWVAALALAVFGVLTITSEYAARTIEMTFIATPDRTAVLAAKALWVLLVALLTGLFVTLATFALCEQVFAGRPIAGQTAAFDEALPLLLASSLAIAAFALLGLAVGALTRSATSAIVVITILWHPLPVLAQHMPAPWGVLIGSLLPMALPGQLAGTGNVDSIYPAALAPSHAALVMLALAVAPLGVAAVLRECRDV